MKLSLSTDFGSPAHWQRLVDFAVHNGVSRLVFWGDCGSAPRSFLGPYRYPKHPELVPESLRPAIEQVRERLASAARLATNAGLEFWYVFQSLEVPDDGHARGALPQLFNEAGEPDMSGELVYQLIRDQLDELKEIAPQLAGVEVWIMECAPICISRLCHQQVPLDEACARLVDVIHNHVVSLGMRMTQDLHTAGGDTVALQAFKRTALQHADVIISADDVIGDYHLHLPFNAHLVDARKTNPIQVNFDLNGEYWGRNFIPTGASQHYAERIEAARSLDPVYINGRVSTGHDVWSPHANVLPSRRRFYPGLAQVRDDAPVPANLEITCTDTLGAAGAEFFCRRFHDPTAQPEDVLREFLTREFGDAADALVPVFMELQSVVAGIFFADSNYHFAQSVPLDPRVAAYFALDLQMTSTAGALFPPEDRATDPAWQRHTAAFGGWSVPVGHRCSGPAAMVEQKRATLATAQRLQEEVRVATEPLSVGDRDFLRRQFEDLVCYAEAATTLCEAQVHFYNLRRGMQHGSIPNAERFAVVTDQLAVLADRWFTRYPSDRYRLGEALKGWVDTLTTPARE